ncbi:heme ABC transporter ATP-binding protein [Rhodospirillum centenum]|uniref:Hemin transport system ATP-binding protein HmuV, putative n=1 Tax=Rhodospirillum centenum (strain ATCC 51521 / SW) TaxID=414684 RepID=B6IY30_RHOCS|nr:heme ABC transporter ATP-binding protein [Rhodospirillum centenum]ACJ01204.1 hemin transport system ATP-binding protein HmuV, putative [Rhodospirillum centenum SW]
MTLAASDLRIVQGGRTLLDRVDLSLDPGAFTVILGPNGAGKSTLLRALCGDLKPARGRVTLDGADVWRLGPVELARRRAVLPQDISVSFPFPAREVVGWGVRDLPPAAADALVARALAAADAAHLADRPVTRLSGGERRRVHLARALAQAWAADRPDLRAVLLLDEPTAGLDPRHQHLVLRLAADLARQGMAVAAVLHDLDLAARYADRVMLLADGRLVALGPPSAVLTPDTIRTVFELDAWVDHCRITGAPRIYIHPPVPPPVVAEAAE